MEAEPCRNLIAALMAEFDQSFAHGTTPQKKHLLHRVVKEVRVHDRVTVEAFYAVPNPDAVRTLGTLARLPPQFANPIRAPLRLRSWPISVRRRRLRGGDARGLGLIGASRDGEVAIVSGLNSPRFRSARPGRKALVWRALLAAGVLANRAALARWQGNSRARVTKVMMRLRRPAVSPSGAV